MTTEFLRKGGPVRKHAANSIAGMIAGTIMGTLVPMLQQWHGERSISDAICAAEQRAVDSRAELKADLQKQLDAMKADSAARDRAQWEAIGRKQDKY